MPSAEGVPRRDSDVDDRDRQRSSVEHDDRTTVRVRSEITDEEPIYWGGRKSKKRLLGLIWERPPQFNAPTTFDAAIYDSVKPVPGTPDPDPYDLETYEAWGQKRFGDEWLNLRRTMIKERNIYFDKDPVYGDRQTKLRMLEHKIEGRPFGDIDGPPASLSISRRDQNLNDPAWKQLWARLQGELPPEDLVCHAFRPPPQGPRSPQSRPPTPPPRVRSPDRNTFTMEPFKLLEWYRTHCKYSAERYNFEKIYLRETQIDDARDLKDDLDGNERRAAELAEIETFRPPPQLYYKDQEKAIEMDEEYLRRMHRFSRLKAGMTEEQIDAEDQAEARERQEAADRAKASREEQTEPFDIVMCVRKMLHPDDFGEAAPAPAPAPTPVAAATGQITAASSANRWGDTRDVQGTTKTRVRKVYHKERSSRRVAHLPPEFRALESTGGTSAA